MKRQVRRNRNLLWREKSKEEEDRRAGSLFYNWRSTLKLIRSTDRLHPAAKGREGGRWGEAKKRDRRTDRKFQPVLTLFNHFFLQ